MPTSVIVLLVVVVIIAILFFSVMGMYNKMVSGKVAVEEGWSNITVMLKKRADLVGNLVETVKGYTTHEKEVFENVAKARAGLVNALEQGPEAASVADAQLQQALLQVNAVAEAYPTLSANQNYLQLQGTLVNLEDQIAGSRRGYNMTVRGFNTSLKVFPNNILANMFNFHEAEFFEVDDRPALETPPSVSF